MSETHIAYIDIDLEDLIPDFLENRHQDVVAIKRMLTQAEFDEIKLIGHSMKGSGGGYGFEEISEIGGRIEVAAREADETVIAQEAGILAAYLSNLKIVYQEE